MTTVNRRAMGVVAAMIVAGLVTAGPTSAAPAISSASTTPSAEGTALLMAGYGTAPPPERYNIRVIDEIPLDDPVASCLNAGTNGIIEGLWADYYCWITSERSYSLWVYV